MRERQLEERMERQRKATEDAFERRAKLHSVDDMRFQAQRPLTTWKVGGHGQLGEDFAFKTREAARLRSRIESQSRELNQVAIPNAGEMVYQGSGLRGMSNDLRGRQGFNEEGVANALDRQQRIYNSMMTDAQRVKSIEEERLHLADAIKTRVKDQRESFAQMDPLMKREAIRLAEKLKKGEELTGNEVQTARSIPVLQEAMLKRSIRRDEKSGDFNRFLIAEGKEQEQKAAQKVEEARKKGIDLKLDVQLDEELLAKKIRADLEKAINDLRTAIDIEGTIRQNQRAMERMQASRRNAVGN